MFYTIMFGNGIVLLKVMMNQNIKMNGNILK